MADNKKSSYRGFTEAQARAHKKYISNFVEVKIRMTAEKRELVRDHAAAIGESVNMFVNGAIDRRMEQDENDISKP